MTKASWEERLFGSQVIVHYQGQPRPDLRAGTYKQELRESWWKVAYWHAPSDLLSVLSYTTLGHPPQWSEPSHTNH